jgi:hypothetical protein
MSRGKIRLFKYAAMFCAHFILGIALEIQAGEDVSSYAISLAIFAFLFCVVIQTGSAAFVWLNVICSFIPLISNAFYIAIFIIDASKTPALFLLKILTPLFSAIYIFVCASWIKALLFDEDVKEFLQSQRGKWE